MKRFKEEERRSIVEWLSMLSRGIDPVTGIQITDDTILNNKRIRKALAEAATIIESLHGNDLSLLKTAACASCIRIPSGVAPMTISELCHLIDDSTDVPYSKSLRPQVVTAWLERRGYLRMSDYSEGYPCRRATAEGEKLGIRSIARTGKNGSIYYLNRYNSNACNFILSHLEAIVIGS